MSKQEYAVVTIDGAGYEFSFEYNSLVEAEDVCGCNLQDALDRLVGAGAMSATQFRGLIYAMICPPRNFPKEVKDQIKYCGNLVRLDTMHPLREALLEACTIAVSEEYHEKYKDVLKRAKEAAAAEEELDKQEAEREGADALRDAGAAVLG